MKRRGVRHGTEEDRAYAASLAERTPGTPAYYALQARIAAEAIRARNKRLMLGTAAVLAAGLLYKKFAR